MASTYTISEILLNSIINQSPTTSGGYTSIKNDAPSASNLFSIDYYDENGTLKTLYFNVYNGETKVSSYGTRLENPTGNVNSNFIGLGGNDNGGAIYNHSNNIILKITGNFIGNYTSGITAQGGAIYNSFGNISFLADNKTNTFTDNYTLANGTKSYNAIYNTGELTFTMAGNGSFVMNDSITGNNLSVNNATVKFGSYTHNDGTNTALNLRNIDSNTYSLGSANFGNSGTGLDIVTSASSLHSVTNVSRNQFTIAFNPNSTLISNSQLGEFMTQIGDDLSAQSTSAANRFIFQASQIDANTKAQAAIIDGGAQLNVIGANHAHTRTAIRAKQNTIGSRIVQQETELASNSYLLASNGNTKGLFTEKKLNSISLWLMPNYTHERVSDMDADSFNIGYTSHLFGITLGTDKIFNTDNYKYYKVGLALDAGLGFSNTRY